jgi:hypothetical protein
VRHEVNAVKLQVLSPGGSHPQARRAHQPPKTGRSLRKGQTPDPMDPFLEAICSPKSVAFLDEIVENEHHKEGARGKERPECGAEWAPRTPFVTQQWL